MNWNIAGKQIKTGLSAGEKRPQTFHSLEKS
jgi:hypothetical protein